MSTTYNYSDVQSQSPLDRCSVYNCNKPTLQQHKLNNKLISVAQLCYPPIGSKPTINKGSVMCDYHFNILVNYAKDISQHTKKQSIQFFHINNDNCDTTSNSSTQSSHDHLYCDSQHSSPYNTYQHDNDNNDVDNWPIAMPLKSNTDDKQSEQFEHLYQTDNSPSDNQLYRSLARRQLLRSKLDNTMISLGWIIFMLFIVIIGLYCLTTVIN